MRTLNSAVKAYVYEVSSHHCTLLKSGLIGYVLFRNRLITKYSKCGQLGLARQLFDEMSQRDTVSWNAMICGYVNFAVLGPSWDLFNCMRQCGYEADVYTYGSLLKGIAYHGEVSKGEQLHCMTVKTGVFENVVTGSSLLDMYAKCGRVDDAYMVFEVMPKRNYVSWNAMIAGFVERKDFDTAFGLLQGMEKEGVAIEDGTVAPFLTLLNDPEYLKLTMQLHGKIVKHGLALYNVVCNALLTSYAECSSLIDAEKVFCGAIDIHDSVTWNSMLGAYLLHNQEGLVIQLFFDMQDLGFEPDIYTYTGVISACFEESYHAHGRCFHCLIIKRGLEGSIAIANSLIAMYQKFGGKSISDALKVFELMDPKDSVSWNSVLTGFSQNGLSEEAVMFFKQMRSHGVGLDNYSFSSTLRSCADLATLQIGRQVHAMTLISGLESNEHVAGSLIVMYTRCGLVDDARRSFEDSEKGSPIPWNFIIFAYAQHGQGHIALELFDQMTKSKVKLDHITFVAVLTACSYMGWVEKGRHILNTMESEHGVPLRMEHYACAIDLFGRAGLLDEARTLLNSMPFKPDAMVLKTFLGACKSCGDVELAYQVAEHLLEVVPEEHCTYIILSDMYGRLKRWEEKANMTRLMRARGVRKVPGWSWIEINNKVRTFNAEDNSHSEGKEIYDALERLTDEIRMLRDSSFEVSDANDLHLAAVIDC